ncbi:MAG: hypothetical protein AB8G96_03680 [Phycisphaerales bacterium]
MFVRHRTFRRSCSKIGWGGVAALILCGGPHAIAAPPEYAIFDLGVIDPGDFGSQGFGVSPDGTIAVGRTLGVSNQGFSWTVDGGQFALPNLPGQPFGAANDAAAGVIVGTCAATAFGSGPLPVQWIKGIATPLFLPAGESAGRANAVNASGVVVGSVDGGSAEQAAILGTFTSSVIATTAPDGSFMRSAQGVSDAGLVGGNGIDPNQAARNVGLIYDIDADTMQEVGAIPGANGALIFGMSSAGHATGSSSMNQGSGRPYVWTAAGGIVEIPLPAGTSQGSGRGVNADGWVVGRGSNAFSIPFLYDGEQTYTIQELLPADTPWDVSTNTSSSADDISDSGVIVGTGVVNGDVRAFAMVPILAPACPADFDRSGDVGFTDLTAVLAAFGPCDGCPPDLNGDGEVDFVDLVAVLSAWGPCV